MKERKSKKNIITVNNEQKKEGCYVAVDFSLRSDHYVENQIIPLYNLEAFASIVSQTVDEEEVEDFISISNAPAADGALFVKGDSMYPLIWNGDLVSYKITRSRRGGLFFGNIYVIAYIEDGEEHIVVKYLDESDAPGYYRLRSHNPNFSSIEIPRDSVRLLAMVKTSMRNY